MRQLITRRLGRTERQVTTMGLGGQASIQWPAKGVDPIAIIEKAYQLGINYLDTSNIYGPSQKNFGEAFHRLRLSPSVNDYNQTAREQLFIASKTHIRTGRCPEGESFRSNFSEGMLDGFGVSTSIDDVRRSLSLLFGDGQGGYPEGAYLDSIQFHNINTKDEVDMLFEGFDDPSPNRPWIGSLAAMLDLREGTNRTGCNPKKEKLIKHIGISGHWNSAAHIYAIQRDRRRIIDTLLVTINPSDCKYMGHRHNAIATAAAADMGVIGMKVFADASYYHKEVRFSNNPKDVYHGVGSTEMPSADLIRYALSVEGISTVIIGIGHIDNKVEKCQLEQNLAAVQLADTLEAEEMNRIEKMVVSAGKDSANAYFQRKSIGLTAPRNMGVEEDSAMPALGRRAVRVSWDTSYAGTEPIERYEVLCNKEVIGIVPHVPQITQQPFHCDDNLNEDQKNGTRQYRVRAVDAVGNQAESQVFEIDLF
ncbi:MAG: aldo/keto reductase [Desulfobacula sp.]|jgi:aryl-alcohol dehydrogenase-like predicted oxidoreductase|nr:aldo/keto reductase [Desulfobacula sp.]